MRGEYLALDSEKKQIKWLTDNRASFAKVLDKLRSDLSDKMFSEARSNVVSYTKCKHDIDHHKIDFIAGINCMATEFLLRNHSKTDIKNVFNRLLSRDDDFPFPPDVDTEERRIAFLAARTFDQQFEGMENALTQPLKDYTFVCRVYNASVPDDFEFTYNKVTFYSPKHEKVAGLKNSEHFSRAVENFFESKIGMLACVKAQYHSMDIAKTEAVNILNQEIKFVNHRFDANCYLDPFTALLTLDFLATNGFTSARKSDGVKIRPIDLDNLKDNPYVILAPYKLPSKEHFLKCEPLYVEALTTKNPTAYWQYFESLLTPPNTQADDKFPFVQTISDILVLNANYHYKMKLIGPYFRNAFVNASPSFLGVSKELFMELAIREAWDESHFDRIRKEIKHPFMRYLLDEFFTTFTEDQLKTCKKHYERVLWETKSERNFDAHTGKRNDKASLLVEHTLPRLGTRLRWMIFKAIEKNDGKDFHEIVKGLVDAVPMRGSTPIIPINNT